MKNCALTPRAEFHIGDLYLFHTYNPRCPASSSLWGFYDKRINDVIYLEHRAISYANLGYVILYPRVIATIVWQRGVSLGIICTILVIVMVEIRFLAEYQQAPPWNIVKKLYI